MTYTSFLYIITPVFLFICGCLIGVAKSNNKSHKEIWTELNNMRERLTRIETKQEIKNNKGV